MHSIVPYKPSETTSTYRRCAASLANGNRLGLAIMRWRAMIMSDYLVMQ
jgi:hypothetical protein